LMAAIREARPVVLEPIVQIEIAVPEHSVGDVTSDLSSRRGLVTGTSVMGSAQWPSAGRCPRPSWPTTSCGSMR
jgi:elongation factor G